jgi:hypothetical protein
MSLLIIEFGGFSASFLAIAAGVSLLAIACGYAYNAFRVRTISFSPPVEKPKRKYVRKPRTAVDDMLDRVIDETMVEFGVATKRRGRPKEEPEVVS